MSGPNDKVLAAARQLQRHPAPLVLLGLGAAWLAIEQLRPRPGEATPLGYSDIYEGYDPDDSLKGRLAARMAVARSKLSGALDQAKLQTENLARSVRAVGYRREARKQLGAHVETEVAVAGLAGLLVGVAIGVAVASRSSRPS